MKTYSDLIYTLEINYKCLAFFYGGMTRVRISICIVYIVISKYLVKGIGNFFEHVMHNILRFMYVVPNSRDCFLLVRKKKKTNINNIDDNQSRQKIETVAENFSAC